MKKHFSIILLTAMLIAALCSTVHADTDIGLEPGQAMPDFTVSLTDGTTATLSEMLKEKDLVVLNCFASWCSPCEKEFPELESVYEENKDRMEIVSVTIEPDDTMEVISAYKADHGITFPMGLAGDSFDYLNTSSVPVTLFIDHDGNVGFIKVGAFLSKAEFEEKVNVFLSPDFDGNPLASEKAVDLFPYLVVVFVISNLMLIIGRWGIFRKAGKKGWHSLIPFLSSYEEYSVSWKGWIGLLAALSIPLALISSKVGLPSVVHNIIIGAGFLLSIPESLKLAKAFGKSKVFGVLMVIPVLDKICRLILGVSKAEIKR